VVSIWPSSGQARGAGSEKRDVHRIMPQARTHTHTCACTGSRSCHMHTHAHTRARVKAHACAHMHTHAHTHTRTCTCTGSRSCHRHTRARTHLSTTSISLRVLSRYPSSPMRTRDVHAVAISAPGRLPACGQWQQPKAECATMRWARQESPCTGHQRARPAAGLWASGSTPKQVAEPCGGPALLLLLRLPLPRSENGMGYRMLWCRQNAAPRSDQWRPRAAQHMVLTTPRLTAPCHAHQGGLNVQVPAPASGGHGLHHAVLIMKRWAAPCHAHHGGKGVQPPAPTSSRHGLQHAVPILHALSCIKILHHARLGSVGQPPPPLCSPWWVRCTAPRSSR